MVSPAMIFEGNPDGSKELRHLLRGLNLTELQMPQPEVFTCGIKQWNEETLVYEFRFYGGFVVHVVAIPSSYGVGKLSGEVT